MADDRTDRSRFAALRRQVRQAEDAVVIPGEGLRERKKRITRQHISDTATDLFLEHGFDEVRVADVAAACDISEKTVFNYFPTKESLLLDREDEMLAVLHRALGPDAPPRSPIDNVVDELEADVARMFTYWDRGDPVAVATLRRFMELIESTPSLRAAQRDMMDRLVQAAAEALAIRAGVDPEDPEPQIAAVAIVGLWAIQFRAMQQVVEGACAPGEEVALVADRLRRAARLIDTGLWSFNSAVQGTTSRQQLEVAGRAANDARKQVLAAIKASRLAWREVVSEAHARRADVDVAARETGRGGRSGERRGRQPVADERPATRRGRPSR